MVEKDPNDLLKELIAALEHEPLVDLHHWSAEVRFQNGELVLEGQLGSIAAKKTAFSIAQKVAGDLPVRDLLRIQPGGHKEDDQLREEVVRTLLDEPAFAECSFRVRLPDGFEELRNATAESGGQVEINVQGGVVALSGHVVSLSHRRLAEVLVWWVAGCEAVENKIQVVPPEDDNDQEIADALRMILEKDPLVHATQLLPSVADGVVTLDGYVASQEEKKLAALDAWYVPGVRNVLNRIQAKS